MREVPLLSPQSSPTTHFFALWFKFVKYNFDLYPPPEISGQRRQLEEKLNRARRGLSVITWAVRD